MRRLRRPHARKWRLFEAMPSPDVLQVKILGSSASQNLTIPNPDGRYGYHGMFPLHANVFSLGHPDRGNCCFQRERVMFLKAANVNKFGHP